MARGQIFVSYASERREQAEPIALALRSRGYDVFFDRDDLPPGDSYHDQIAAAIDRADIMLFALSPESVDKGRYTVSEIGLARRKWKTPKGRVLPVMVAPTPMDDIPAYLKEVSVLEAQGNLVADTAIQVDEMFADIRKAESARTTGIALKVGAGLVALAVVGFFSWQAFVIPPEQDSLAGRADEGGAPVPASPPAPAPEGVQTVRTPVLGIQIVQDGAAPPVYVVDRDGFTSHSVIQLKRGPFEVRLPAGLWTAADATEPGLQVAMSGDGSIFEQVQVEENAAETRFFAPGTGMADSEFGSGTLFSTDSEYPDCCWGHNFFSEGRFNVSGEGYRGFFVSSLENKVTQENMLAASPSIYLVFYLNRDDPAAWTDWEAPDPLRYNELERVELRFTN